LKGETVMAKRKRDKSKVYIVISCHSEDSEPEIRGLTGNEIERFINRERIHFTDYAIIDGIVLKGFNSVFDLKSL
jgi:hypothetical protein